MNKFQSALELLKLVKWTEVIQPLLEVMTMESNSRLNRIKVEIVGVMIQFLSC